MCIQHNIQCILADYYRFLYLLHNQTSVIHRNMFFKWIKKKTINLYIYMYVCFPTNSVVNANAIFTLYCKIKISLTQTIISDPSWKSTVNMTNIYKKKTIPSQCIIIWPNLRFVATVMIHARIVYIIRLHNI